MSTCRVFVGYRCLLTTGLILALGVCCLGGEPAFECFAVPDVVRVFEDGYHCPPARDRIEVFGIRNEWVSAQCAVRARQTVRNLKVSVSPLRLKGGNAMLPADAVAWNFVNSIAITENTPKQRKADLIRTAPARFPDYLSGEIQTTLEAGQCKAVYLTLSIPPEMSAGDYEGAVSFHSEQGDGTLPLTLTVYPLTLPEQRHLMVTEWFTTGRFAEFHGIDSSNTDAFYKMLKLYAQNMADHRQNVFRVPLDLITTTRRADGALAFDFSRFDRWAEVFWATGRMDLLETGFVARFREGGWSSREIVLRDFPVRNEAGGSVTMPGEEFLSRFLPALEQHLREQGWLDKTVFHIADEPSNHNVMSWRECSDFVHRHGPHLRRMDAIETPHCLDRLEVWVPKLDHYATWQDAFTEAQKQGYEMWFYTVGIFQGGSFPNKTVDVPLIQSRTLHWFNYRFGLTGYLHWGFNAWTEDPFEAPGQHRGDGWHVYPKRDGLLNSLRWEQMRNGLQDYEYFWLLEDGIRRMKSRMSPRVAALMAPKRRGIEIAARVVRTTADYSNDPNVLYAARKQILQEILDLEQPPQVLVQTNPMEHMPVAGNVAIDVHGWAEPGARITINGAEVPVAEDGLFLENVRISRQRTVVVEVKKDGSSRRIVRCFSALYESVSRE